MPAVVSFLERIKMLALREMKIENPFGHVRYLDSSEDSSKLERQAVNTLMQGTAASLIKRAILRLEALPQVQILASVFDSVLVQFPTSNMEDTVRDCIHAMEATGLNTPFPVDFAVAQSWGDCMEGLHSGSTGMPSGWSL
jgi:DNA polymerase-1